MAQKNTNGNICCTNYPNHNLAEDYDTLPPELRRILRYAPYSLWFNKHGEIRHLCARGDIKAAVAMAIKSIKKITRDSAKATYGPDHPQAQ